MSNVRFYIDTTEPTASSSYAGALFFNSTTNKISRCKDDGSAWENYGGADNVEILTSTGDPSTGTEKQGVLYVNTYDKTLKIWIGTRWVTLAEEKTTTVRDVSSATDTAIPTELAVRTAIDAATVDVSSSTSSANVGLAPRLDSTGMLPSSVIPAYALSEYKGAVSAIIADPTANPAVTGLTGLSTAEIGDFAVVTEGADKGTYILTGTYSDSTKWIRIAEYVYSLPIASSSTLGGVKINGNNLSINSTTGVLSATDTWRAIKVSGTQQLASNVNTALNFAGSGATSLSYSSGTLTISSTNTTYTAGTAIAIDPNNSNAIGVKLASGSALTTDTSGNLEIQWQTPSQS